MWLASASRKAPSVRRRSLRVLPLLAAVLLLVVPTLVRADPLDDATRRVARQLQCPVCEGQNVADSNSGLAQDMRAVMRGKIEAGESDQQILDFFVSRYGEGILTEPPKRGLSLVVWAGPVIALALGTFFLAAFVSRAAGRRRGAEGAPRVAADGAVAEEMRRFRREVG